MLEVHRIATTNLCAWGSDITEPEFKPTPPTNFTPEQSSQDAGSWININEKSTSILGSENSSTTFACAGELECVSRADLRCNTPTTNPASSGITLATESYILDTVTFPSHAAHLLPSEQNGTWHTPAHYALENLGESALTFRGVLERYTNDLDVPTLLHKLKHVAENHKDDLEDFVNRSLADCDLVETHNRVRCLVLAISKPNIRQVDHAIDTMTEIVQYLRKRRSKPELLEQHHDDKYVFAQILYQKARRALFEQGICKEWQIMNGNHTNMQNSMQSALIKTFTDIKHLYTNVLLFRAKPLWVADQGKKGWRLELDAERVMVEVGPVTNISLVELGLVDTGFELPESCGCVSIMDLNWQVHVVEDEWQLLEE